MSTIARWEHFQHQADVGLRGIGPTPAAAFEQAALALTAVVTGARVTSRRRLDVTCRAGDLETLLVDWLNQLIYLMATEGLLFGEFAVTIDGNHLRARIGGELVNRRRHQPAVEIKAATYTELAVRHQADGNWLAQCVVDV